jgi:hypothetical protein
MPGSVHARALTPAARQRLEEELALCERRIELLRELIGTGETSAATSRRQARHRGRPNAGIRRFLLEAIRAQPGVDIATLSHAMAEKGFVGTPSRPLKSVVAHEIRTLVRHELVTQLPGRRFAPSGEEIP